MGDGGGGSVAAVEDARTVSDLGADGTAAGVLRSLPACTVPRTRVIVFFFSWLWGVSDVKLRNPCTAGTHHIKRQIGSQFSCCLCDDKLQSTGLK